MLSLCMIVKDEEENLDKCLKSVAEFVDDIVIVDTGSTDSTKAIAKQYTKKVYCFEWCNDFSKARNFSISKAYNDWILILDADEILYNIDKEKVYSFIENNERVVGRIKRTNTFEDEKGIKKYIERVNRLFNKNYFQYDGIIHEQVVSKVDNTYETEPIEIEVSHIGYLNEVLNRTNKLERNINLLSSAIRDNTQDPYLYYQIGKSYYSQKNYEKAYVSFLQAMKLELNFKLEYVEDLIESYGYNLLKCKKYKEALNLKKYEDYYGVLPDYNFLMGLIYMNNSIFEEAIKYFKKCLGEKEGKIEGINTYHSNYNIGVIYETLGFENEALCFYKKCGEYNIAKKRIDKIMSNKCLQVEVDFKNINRIKKYIKQYIETNKLMEAKYLLDEAIKVEKEDIELYSMKAVLEIMENRLQDAEDTLRHALIIDDKNFDILYNMGYLYEVKKDNDLSIDFYLRALKVCESEEIRKDLALYINNLNQGKEECEYSNERVKEQIQILIDKGCIREAKETLKQYEKIVFDDIEIYFIKANIELINNNIDEAKNILNEGLYRYGEDFDLLFNIAYLYKATGEKKLSIEYCQKALRNASTEEMKSKVYKVLSELGEKEIEKNFFKDIKLKEKGEKLKVVFFPYKVSMWDSLATVYEAASEDPNCTVNVVPIPYYQLLQDKAVHTYEGESFPSDIPITHYSDYNIEEENPDIVFVHNIYDQYNTITRVYEKYFTCNLKKYTDMLVYIPYHIPSLFPPYGKEATYTMPSAKNVDKIVLINDILKENAINDGIPESKLISLGSPKIDSMVRNLKVNRYYPIEWEEKIAGKTVYVLDTGCLHFLNNTFSKIEEITNILNITNLNKNTAIIWRPHPLTKTALMKYSPELLQYYNTLTEEHIKGDNKLYNNVILDETDNYLYALNASDVLISGNGSLLGAYLLTEKKIIFLDKEMPKGSVVPENTFYYFYNETESWYELIEKINSGYDPLAKNRKGVASSIYKNLDGTCGEKIYGLVKSMINK